MTRDETRAKLIEVFETFSALLLKELQKQAASSFYHDSTHITAMINALIMLYAEINR